MGGKVHRTKETHSKVCRHSRLFVRERHIQYTCFYIHFIYVQTKISRWSRVLLSKLIAKIFIFSYLCLMCTHTHTIYNSSKAIEEQDDNQFEKRKKQQPIQVRMNKWTEKSHLFIRNTPLDDKTIQRHTERMCTEQKKKSCDFNKKKIKYMEGKQNCLHIFTKFND